MTQFAASCWNYYTQIIYGSQMQFFQGQYLVDAANVQ